MDKTAAGLSDRDRAILEFERTGWRNAGTKEQAIRTELGLSAARYYQVLGVLIESPEALIYDPMLINRLQRMREERARARSRRTLPPAGQPD